MVLVPIPSGCNALSKRGMLVLPQSRPAALNPEANRNHALSHFYHAVALGA
jgi:hypothetical protein